MQSVFTSKSIVHQEIHFLGIRFELELVFLKEFALFLGKNVKKKTLIFSARSFS